MRTAARAVWLDGHGCSFSACDNLGVTVPMPSSAAATTPSGIHADRTAGRLTIEWADGHRTTYDTVALRWLCPCAYCRGEAGMPGWLDSAPTLTEDQTRLTDAQLVGSYALCPMWADGHHTGYYTWSLLRDRCPCGECSARRAAQPQTPSVLDRHGEHA